MAQDAAISCAGPHLLIGGKVLWIDYRGSQANAQERLTNASRPQPVVPVPEHKLRKSESEARWTEIEKTFYG